MYRLYIYSNKEGVEIMKKWVALMMICLLVVGCVGFSNGYCLAATRPEPDSLQYTLTKRVEASLEISSTGKATCRGYIRASSTDSTIDITVKLMQKNGTVWKIYDSWSATDVKSVAELVKTCTVEPGTYKVTVTGTVKSNAGKKEPVSTSSSQKTYP